MVFRRFLSGFCWVLGPGRQLDPNALHEKNKMTNSSEAEQQPHPAPYRFTNEKINNLYIGRSMVEIGRARQPNLPNGRAPSTEKEIDLPALSMHDVAPRIVAYDVQWHLLDAAVSAWRDDTKFYGIACDARVCVSLCRL